MQVTFWIADRLLKSIRAVVAAMVVVFFSYMTIAVLAQVFGRYIFNYSIAGASETATFAQIWMVFLAAGLAMREKLHVGVDILYAVLPRLLQRVVAVLILVAGVWFLWLAFTGSWRLIQVGMMQTSPALQMPMWLAYLSLPVGISYFALEFCISYIRKIWAPVDASEVEETEK